MPIKNLFRLKKKQAGSPDSPGSINGHGNGNGNGNSNGFLGSALGNGSSSFSSYTTVNGSNAAIPSSTTESTTEVSPPQSNGPSAMSSSSSLYTTPATFVSTVSASGSNPVYEQYMQLSKKPDFPQELTPIVTLLNCHAARIYAEGEILLNTEHNGTEENEDDLFFDPAEATLRGTTLYLSSSTTHKPVTLDLLEATIHIQEQHMSLVLSTTHRAAHHLKFHNLKELQGWVSTIMLSVYEYTRLSLCYTASLLSSKATHLSDLHVVMSELKFTKEEWVDIKFSKDAQWLRCYMTISPGNNKHSGNVSFYSSNKTTKRNLICSVSTINNCHAVYPSVVELIDNSSLIRLQGDITLYGLGGSSHSSSNSAISSPIASPNLNNASSPRFSQQPQQQHQKHSRHTSINSISSAMSSSSTKSNKGYPVHNTSLYILPQSHGGVAGYETMIRLLIPLYDAFKLYGRPKKLVADKRSSSSLLFGLPSLPRVKILTTSMARSLIEDNWSLVVSDPLIYFPLFDTQLSALFADDATYSGFGDLRDSIQKANIEHPYTRRMSLVSQSDTPRYVLSLNDLPAGLSTEALNGLQTDEDVDAVAMRLRATSIGSGSNSMAPPSRLRSPSIGSNGRNVSGGGGNGNGTGHKRTTSRASQLREESYTNLNHLMSNAVA